MKVKKIAYTNLAVFVILFGVALIEAIEKQSWGSALLFVVLGVMSVWADLTKKN